MKKGKDWQIPNKNVWPRKLLPMNMAKIKLYENNISNATLCWQVTDNIPGPTGKCKMTFASRNAWKRKGLTSGANDAGSYCTWVMARVWHKNLFPLCPPRQSRYWTIIAYSPLRIWTQVQASKLKWNTELTFDHFFPFVSFKFKRNNYLYHSYLLSFLVWIICGIHSGATNAIQFIFNPKWPFSTNHFVPFKLSLNTFYLNSTCN